jgi:hypothetical protein
MLVFILAPHINTISLSAKSSIKIKRKRKKKKRERKKEKPNWKRKMTLFYPLVNGAFCMYSLVLAKIGEFG